ncbi:MAG TPA: phage holin family protein [Vicinamibacterales bacterium]|nr:phage holin family protein [Vicinamibacterales bacterium]
MAAQEDRSLGQVLGDIADNVQQIVRAEIRLAKAELRQDVVVLKRSAALVAIGGIAGAMAVAFLLLAAVYALSTVMAPWAAALIVAAAAGLAGVLCMNAGIKSVKHLGLPRTAGTLQENVQWAKTRER